MKFDIVSDLVFKSAIAPVTVADNTAQVSAVLDVQGMKSVGLAILAGTIADADATFTVLIEESNLPGSGFTAAPANVLLNSTTVGFKFDDDGETRKVGYIGSKRYLRATITPANNTGNAPLSAVWYGEVEDAPAANPA